MGGPRPGPPGNQNHPPANRIPPGPPPGAPPANQMPPMGGPPANHMPPMGGPPANQMPPGGPPSNQASAGGGRPANQNVSDMMERMMSQLPAGMSQQMQQMWSQMQTAMAQTMTAAMQQTMMQSFQQQLTNMQQQQQHSQPPQQPQGGWLMAKCCAECLACTFPFLLQCACKYGEIFKAAHVHKVFYDFICRRDIELHPIKSLMQPLRFSFNSIFTYLGKVFHLMPVIHVVCWTIKLVD